MARLLPIAALLGVVGSAYASAHVADRLAVVAAERLATLVPTLRPAAESEPVSSEPAVLLAAAPASPGAEARSRGTKATKRAVPAKPRSVFVSAAKVLALVESGARPRGTPVRATAKRPAGLKLTGVTGLGIGVLDGDVLTEAVGVPALNAGAVIEAVLRARSRGETALSGTCYRGDERYAIVVEQPYPRRP